MIKEKSRAEVTSGSCAEQDGNSREPSYKKLKKYLFSILFMVVLMAVTFYIIFKDNSVDDILNALMSTDIRWVVAGAVLIILSKVFQALSVGMSANCIGQSLTFWQMIQYALVGDFYSGITPSATGGQPMQMFYLCRDKMSVSNATLVLFTVNIAYQLGIVVIAIVMLIAQFGYVASTQSGMFVLFAFGFLLHFSLLVFLAIVLLSENTLNKLVRFGVRMGMKLHLIKNEENAYKSVADYVCEVKGGVELIKNHPWRFAVIILFVCLQIFTYHFIPACVYKAFGFQSGFTAWQIVGISMVLFMSVSFLPLPGMVGASERGYVVLYRSVFPGHVMAATLLSRFISFYVVLVIAGLFAVFIQLRKPYDLSKQKLKSAGEGLRQDP